MLDISNFLYAEFSRVSVYGNPPSDYRVDCPFCMERVGSDDHKGHLHVSINVPMCHCFRCDYQGSWAKLVVDCLDVSYADAYARLKGTLGVSEIENIGEHIQRKPRATRVRHDVGKECVLPADFVPLASDAEDRLLKTARLYMKKRGFGEDYWKRYNLGVAQSVGYRVIIPIEGSYWQARALYPFIEPRYTAPSVPSDGVLFRSVALRGDFAEIVVCEGAFSAMAVGDHAVALVGKNPTHEKMCRLLDAPVQRFVVALERGAFRSMNKLCDVLYTAGKEVILWVYESGDPADSQPSRVEMYDWGTKLAHLLA